jgi:hypothetical protein
VARGPLARAASAFNWRRKILVADGRQRNRFTGEYEALSRYGSLNELASALYSQEGVPNEQALEDIKAIHHLREDIAFYLNKLLKQVWPEQVLAVLMQETLNQDIESCFGIKTEQKSKENSSPSEPEMLDDLARRNLLRYFEKDFECLTKLYCWGKISNETFIKAVAPEMKVRA